MYDDLSDVHWPPLQSYAELFNPIRVDNPWFVFFWALCYGAMLFLLQRFVVRRNRLKIQFYLTDFWAAIVALTPSFALLLNDATDSVGGIIWRQIGLFALAFASTSSGIWAWIVLSTPAQDEPRPGRLSRILSVLSGGLIGLVGVFITGFAFECVPMIPFSFKLLYYALYCWIALIIVMPPLLLVSLAFIYINKKAYDFLTK